MTPGEKVATVVRNVEQVFVFFFVQRLSEWVGLEKWGGMEFTV